MENETGYILLADSLENIGLARDILKKAFPEAVIGPAKSDSTISSFLAAAMIARHTDEYVLTQMGKECHKLHQSSSEDIAIPFSAGMLAVRHLSTKGVVPKAGPHAVEIIDKPHDPISKTASSMPKTTHLLLADTRGHMQLAADILYHACAAVPDRIEWDSLTDHFVAGVVTDHDSQLIHKLRNASEKVLSSSPYRDAAVTHDHGITTVRCKPA